jgi:hypothetical protein
VAAPFLGAPALEEALLHAAFRAATIEATEILVSEDFVVLPYTSPDLVAAMRLEEAGAATVMPLGSPIGSGQGVPDWAGIYRIVERISSVPVVVDAGIGASSDAPACAILRGPLARKGASQRLWRRLVRHDREKLLRGNIRDSG